jgi:hypothetical protein
MNAIEAQIEERLPVWDALSELFLDTALQPDDYDRIAKILAASPYPENEIEEILISEVGPVCGPSFFFIAGEWLGFDSQWLKTKIAPRIGKTVRPKWLYKLRYFWAYLVWWNKVRKLVAKARTR